ncbi:Aspartate aminotransferase, mitochondrial, partial [Linum perenne]
RFAGVPALSGTGGCRLFAEFQRRFFPESPIYLPDPTWSNHYNIWTNASVPTRIYRYYHPHSKGLDFAALMNDVKNAPDGSFFLLHPCAHNPTGVDPTEEQWREISNLFKVKNHFPFFDMAYQGLVSGDMDRDAWSIRVFLDDGHLIGCSQSFSKTMGLFEHRVGCLSVLCSDTEKARQVQSQLHRITGAMYGSVPSHGLVLLSTVLSNPELKSLWTKEVKSMANHIQSTRSTLRESLELTGSNHNWEHITKQVGIFSLSGLTPDQIDRLADDFHIYTTPNGRISMTGITTSNVSYIANAFHEVTKAMMNKGSLFQTS